MDIGRQLVLEPREKAKKEVSIKSNTEVFEKESKILNSFDPCSEYESGIFLPTIRSRKLEELVRKQYYNPDVLGETSCILSSLNKSDSVYSPGFKIRRYINSLKVINSGTEGVISKGTLRGSNSFLIIKSSKNVQEDVILHEAFIGMLGTNKLRKQIPNFVYIYGQFSCGKIIDDNYWCETGGRSVRYMIQENIEGETLAEFMKKCSKKDFLNIYLQICLSLYTANEELDYSHNDLHARNVIIKKLEKEEYIHYFVLGKTLKVTHLAVIIDLGLSHIKYEGEHFGSYGREHFGTFGDKSNVLNDSYRILLNCAAGISGKRDIGFLNEIYNIFNPGGDISLAVKEQRTIYYTLPYISESNKKLKYLIEQLDNRNRISLDYIPQSMFLNCENSPCAKRNELTYDGSKMNISLADIFDIYESFDFLSSFDYRFEEARSRFFEESGNLLLRMKEILDNAPKLKISSKADITSDNLMKYMSAIIMREKCNFLSKDLILYYEVYKVVCNKLGKPDLFWNDMKYVEEPLKNSLATMKVVFGELSGVTSFLKGIYNSEVREFDTNAGNLDANPLHKALKYFSDNDKNKYQWFLNNFISSS